MNNTHTGTFHPEETKRTHTNFASLSLSPLLLRAVASQGYLTPTPIQTEAIPPILAGRDLLGCAQTGTGKTAAFALPILHHLALAEPQKPRRVRAVVLAPTRELALQIEEAFAAYGRCTGLRVAAVYGGVSQNPQVQALRRGTDILVATPGRLLDLMRQGFVNLSSVHALVLDEADRMLDMGFIHDVRRIVAAAPQGRQTLLFSATIPEEIRRLAAAILSNPVTVQISPEVTRAENIEQTVYYVDKDRKADLLCTLLDEQPITRALVFTRTKHGADRLVRRLQREGVAAEAIHGNKAQAARQRALESFRSRATPVLVATDVAARGLDVDEVSHVFNYDLPQEPETYVHRIGRTARAGASGVALSFCDFDERAHLFAIEKLLREPIPVMRDGIREVVKQPVAAPAEPRRGAAVVYRTRRRR